MRVKVDPLNESFIPIRAFHYKVCPFALSDKHLLLNLIEILVIFNLLPEVLHILLCSNPLPKLSLPFNWMYFISRSLCGRGTLVSVTKPSGVVAKNPWLWLIKRPLGSTEIFLWPAFALKEHTTFLSLFLFGAFLQSSVSLSLYFDIFDIFYFAIYLRISTILNANYIY